MTRKDYILLADSIAEALDLIDVTLDDERIKTDEKNGIYVFQKMLEKNLKRDNSRFDADKFSEHISKRLSK